MTSASTTAVAPSSKLDGLDTDPVIAVELLVASLPLLLAPVPALLWLLSLLLWAALAFAAERLAELLPRQRWFASKGRPIASVAVRDAASLGGRAPGAVLTLLDVVFEQGPGETWSCSGSDRWKLQDAIRLTAAVALVLVLLGAIAIVVLSSRGTS